MGDLVLPGCSPCASGARRPPWRSGACAGQDVARGNRVCPFSFLSLAVEHYGGFWGSGRGNWQLNPLRVGVREGAPSSLAAAAGGRGEEGGLGLLARVGEVLGAAGARSSAASCSGAEKT